MVERAQFLFDSALAKCWDKEYGGILYGFSPAGEICDDDKYFCAGRKPAAAALLGAKLAIKNTGSGTTVSGYTPGNT